ncbi:MAG TPA: ABC transporter permease [Dongiaceae bacterium]|nr:ABC transporter permease [Dongiaceae bacterium]
MKFASIILANLGRAKVRLLLTIGSIATAILLFAYLAVVNRVFTLGADVASAERLIVMNRAGFLGTVPLSYRDKILQIPGIKVITHDNWFPGIYQDGKEQFPQFVIDPESQRQVFPELILPEDQWQAFLRDRQGAILGRKTAERLHLRIGDRVPLVSTLYGSDTWEMNLVGIYHGKRAQTDETQLWLRWDYFEEKAPAQAKGQVGWFVLRVENPDDAARIAKTIDEKFANSSNETRTQTESAFVADFVKQFANIKLLILAIGSVVFFTLLLVTGNTMAVSVRERVRELAVFKAIGFSNRSVLTLILAESLAIALVGGLVGLILAALTIRATADTLSALLPGLDLGLPQLLTLGPLGLLVAAIVGVISGIMPGISILRLRVVNALRRV